MSARAMTSAALCLALAVSGCALVPKENARLEEARAAQAMLHADARVAAFAPAEARRAAEAFDLAQHASDTLLDPALVDHLSYVARQRAAIAFEVARRGAEARPGLRPVSGSPQ